MTAATCQTETSFRLWRRRMGYTQAEAAAALGVSASQIQNWDAGHDRGRGRPSIPPYAVRVLMAALVRDAQTEPWPP